MKKSTSPRKKTTKIGLFQKLEPTSIDPEKINASILSILNWYRNQNYDVDIQKQWLVDGANKLQVVDAELIKFVPENYIIDSNAFVARMLCNDVNLLEKNVISLVDKLKLYVVKGRENQETKEYNKEQRVAPIERVKQTTEIIVATIVEYLEEDSFDVVDYVVKNCLGVAYVKQLIKKLDEERHKKAISELTSWLESNKKERKPRKKKVKTPEEICKLFVCCEEEDGVKSIPPTKILGSECVVCYHTQTKKIQFYVGKKLTVHRSMIMGWEKKKSFECEISDKKQLTEVALGGKININKVYNEYEKSAKSGVTGRVTKKIIVVSHY